MGRYKSVEIKGLFFDSFEKLFETSLINSIKGLDLSENDIIDRLTPHYQDLILMYQEAISSVYLKGNKFNLNQFLEVHFQNQTSIATTNKSSFVPFLLYINTCIIAYRKIIEKIHKKRIDSTLKTNVALYGVVIRKAEQIADLLLSGHIDAAMIIWRSLYENAIILLFLAYENDPNLAEKFQRHSMKNAKNKLASFNKHYKALNFKPLSKSVNKKIKEETDNLEREFGRKFLDNDYGWADGLFEGKQKATFREIEIRIEMSRFRPYYLLCCEQMHSSFNSLLFFSERNRIVLPKLLQQSMKLSHFVDPMQFTLSVLHEVNQYVLYEFSNSKEYEANCLLLKKIFEQQQTSFSQTKRSL